jgi:hypothetical protein
MAHRPARNDRKVVNFPWQVSPVMYGVRALDPAIAARLIVPKLDYRILLGSVRGR